ncbi:MAG: GNAT family N-acetyltransferase [Pseudomonadota bacterium]
MFRIELLKKFPTAIPRLAEIWREVLGKIWMPECTLAETEQRFRTHLNDDMLPLTFVAFSGETPVGMCSLRADDGLRDDLTPWLGSLVVDAQYQKQGLGKQLIETTKEKARTFGFHQLFLATFDPKVATYYESLGWEDIGTSEYSGHALTVMRTGL